MTQRVKNTKMGDDFYDFMTRVSYASQVLQALPRLRCPTQTEVAQVKTENRDS